MARRTSHKQSIGSCEPQAELTLKGLDFETAVRAALDTGTMPDRPKRKAKRAKPKGKK
jgi:hypothetical protein